MEIMEMESLSSSANTSVSSGSQVCSTSVAKGEAQKHSCSGPTVLKIKTMEGADGESLKIVQEIAAGDYMTFGMCLLQDENGHEVDILKKDNISEGAEAITLSILKKWLTSGSAPTRTYQHLMECLRKCKLCTLADNIADVTGIYQMVTLSSPPTKKAKSQSADPVTSYAQYLKYRYRQPLPDDDKLPAALSKHYIELAVISSKKISRKEADEFTRKTLHGLTEEVLRKKTPIALENILKPGENGKPVRCVLVEGAPGAGKSTLAWELCHRWEELECVRQYDLVVLVQLRTKRSQEATCLGDLFPLFGGINTEELLASMGNGKGTLLILDGFDELPQKQRGKNSVYIDLIKGAPDMLPEATVIVTSRPSVSADFLHLCRHNIDRRVEVLGFTPEQIEEYARSVFGDSKELEAFLQYINSNPVIKGMMYLALNAVIVASIFKDSYGADCPYPTTMTQLYDALTRSLIRRHLVDKKIVDGMYQMPTQSLQCREDIDKLPPGVTDRFLVLARVAYEGLRDDRYVFVDLGLEFDPLGVMKETTSLDVSIGPTRSFSFFHLTLQEYLSAVYISLELHNGLEVPLSFFNRRDMVLRFLAGLCDISGNTILCQKLYDYFIHISRDDGKIQLLRAFRNLQLVQCVYECNVHKTTVIKSLFQDNVIYVTGFLPFDYYLIGHCISHTSGRWHVRVDTHEDVGQLMQGLGSYNKGKLQWLEMGFNSDLSVLDPIVTMCQHDLQCLYLTDAEFTKSHMDFLCRFTSICSFIFISNCCPSDLLLPILFGPSSLKSLELNSLFIYNAVDFYSVNLLQNNSNLKKLKIYNLFGNLVEDFLRKLLTTLRINTSLVHFELEFTGDLIYPVVPLLTSLIQVNCTLQKLTIVIKKFKRHKPQKVAALVWLAKTAAQKSTSLKKLTCDTNTFELVRPHIPRPFRKVLKRRPISFIAK